VFAILFYIRSDILAHARTLKKMSQLYRTVVSTVVVLAVMYTVYAVWRGVGAAGSDLVDDVRMTHVQGAYVFTRDDKSIMLDDSHTYVLLFGRRDDQKVEVTEFGDGDPHTEFETLATAIRDATSQDRSRRPLSLGFAVGTDEVCVYNFAKSRWRVVNLSKVSEHSLVFD